MACFVVINMQMNKSGTVLEWLSQTKRSADVKNICTNHRLKCLRVRDLKLKLMLEWLIVMQTGKLRSSRQSFVLVVVVIAF